MMPEPSGRGTDLGMSALFPNGLASTGLPLYGSQPHGTDGERPGPGKHKQTVRLDHRSAGDAE